MAPRVEAGAAPGLSDPAADPPAPQLPEAVVECILQQVPLWRRLTVCSLVCKAWAAAAARSTRSVALAVHTKKAAAGRLQLLRSWISDSQQQLTSLQLYPLGYVPPLAQGEQPNWRPIGTLQLPCSSLTRLQELRLTCLDVKLPAVAVLQPSAVPPTLSIGTAASPSNDSTEIKPSLFRRPLLPALRRLHLQQCTLETVASMVHLAWSPVLISLMVWDVKVREEGQAVDLPSSTAAGSSSSGSGTGDTSGFNQGLATLLEQLPGLQFLKLFHKRLQPASLNSITAMQGLQHLTVGFGKVRRNDPWPCSLPTGLTYLSVNVRRVQLAGAAGQPGVRPVAATSQWLASLRHAQELREVLLSNCEFDPELLRYNKGLDSLTLNPPECSFLPGGQDGTQALLSSLGCLTQLGNLHCVLHPHSVQGLAPDLFAALTASQRLTCLLIGNTMEQPLPRGAARHMFKRCLPQLLELAIVCHCHDPNQLSDVGPDDWCLRDEDVCSIARACPKLKSLQLRRVVQPSATLSGLQLLPPSLTSLAVWELAFTDAAAAVAAQLTQLRCFEWDCAPHLSDVGFQHLTALTGLTRLFYDCWYDPGALSLSDDLFRGTADPMGHGKSLLLVNTNGQGPVWQQVQAMCRNSPACMQELSTVAAGSPVAAEGSIIVDGA